MQIHNLQRGEGKKKKMIRRGRGGGSKRGNYSGKGCKGQKVRAGFSLRVGFEGGQTPLFKKLPKNKGFKRYYKLHTEILPINIGNIERDDKIKNEMEINMGVLTDLGYCKFTDNIKILGKGDLTKKLSFIGMYSVSKSAKQKIEKIGGNIELQLNSGTDTKDNTDENSKSE